MIIDFQEIEGFGKSNETETFSVIDSLHFMEGRKTHGGRARSGQKRVADDTDRKVKISRK